MQYILRYLVHVRAILAQACRAKHCLVIFSLVFSCAWSHGGADSLSRWRRRVDDAKIANANWTMDTVRLRRKIKKYYNR